jgi:hypothetical protein
MLKLFSLVLLIALLSLVQTFGFSIFDIKPNLALVAVITASFFLPNFWQGFLLVVLAALILKFSSDINAEILTFSFISAGAIIIKKYLPWHNFLSLPFLLIIGTFIFYLFLAHNLILSAIFAKELFLNLIAGISIFALLSFLWKNK